MKGIGKPVKVAVGCDHRGLKLKKHVLGLLDSTGHAYEDFGSYSEKSVDYPDIAARVSRAVAGGDFDRGILVCATGIGMCIAANKVAGIRAALCQDAFCAQRARQHNDANVLCLGALNGHDGVTEVVRAFLTTGFEGGRHQCRIDKMRDMES